METSPLAHAATGASRTTTTNGAASPANDPANAAVIDAQAAPNEPDLWGALSPVTSDAAAQSFASMEPAIHVSHAPLNQSSAANPFDAFDAFAPSSTSSHASSGSETLVLPPPAPQQSSGHAVVALGSLLLSFSPVASASTSSTSLSLDTTTTTTTTTGNAFAVDDLLSFSPVAAALASSSSSLMMMDDFFLGSAPSSVETTRSQDEMTAIPAETTSVEPTTSSLLSFSPVASVPHAPFSDGFFTSDLSGFSRGSFGGFDGDASIDHIAPHSAPAAFGEMEESLSVYSEELTTGLKVTAEDEAEACEDDPSPVEVPVKTEAAEEQEVHSKIACDAAASVATAPSEEIVSPVAGSWTLESEMYAVAGDYVATSRAVVDGVVEGDRDTVDDEDPKPPLPEVIDHTQDIRLVTEVEDSPPQAETATVPVDDAWSPSSSFEVSVDSEDTVEAVVAEASLPSPHTETREHNSLEAFNAEGDISPEVGHSPVNSVAEVESPFWQTQQSPETEQVVDFEALSASTVANEDRGFENREATSSSFIFLATTSSVEIDQNEGETFSGFNDTVSPQSSEPTVISPAAAETSNSFGFLSTSPSAEVDQDGGDAFGGFNDAVSPVSNESTDASPAANEADNSSGFESDGALEGDDNYAERESDMLESQFESEATALYAEVEDEDDDDLGSNHHDDHHVLNVSVARLQLPLPEPEHGVQSPENRVTTPSSVVSSPGSSVAGSAFAFISGGTSSFSFVPTAPSPQSECTERASFEVEEDGFSPVATHYEVAPEDADETDEVGSVRAPTHEPGEFDKPAELESDEGFGNFNDATTDTNAVNDEVVSSTIETEVSSGFQSLSGFSHPGEDSGSGSDGFNDAVVDESTGASPAVTEASSSFGFETSTQSTETASHLEEAGSSFGFLASSQSAELDQDEGEAFGGFDDTVSPVADESSDDLPAAAETDSSFEFESFEAASVDTGSSFSFVASSQSAEYEGVGFGGFNDAGSPVTNESPSASPAAVKTDNSSGFASFTHNTATVSATEEPDSSFGFLSSSQSANIDEYDGDDGFGGFGQSTAAGDDDGDDDFGDFGTASAWGSSTVSGTANDNDDDDDFGDFTPSSASQQWGEATSASASAPTPASSSDWGTAAYEPQPVAVSVPAPTDLNEFFASAFPASKTPVATSLLPKPTPSLGSAMPTLTASAIFDQANGGAVHKSFHASLQEYRTMLMTEHDEHPHQQQPSFESEALRLKYLKYVLTEKLTEASRPDGVFPHGSEKYHLFASIAESSHEKNMRDALAQLQEGLFQGSVNEAVMRIAKQAALSAKARIAEQAAQQQAHARGSILATTRHFLSRSAGGSASAGPGSADKDNRGSRTGSGSLGVLTPTGASVHKISRFSFQNGQESEVGNSSGYGSGEDTGSDVSVGEASGHSEGDSIGAPGGGPGSGSGPSGRGGGGLMKKFHERLTSFSSTKQRPRTVSLRRMGQSSEDVVQMELHMESINGGFDEVKWRCAVFLYESEEVAHLAPSQITILAYPSNQLLSGKSDRSALSKFFKPGTIWSIDIGASSNAGVSME